MTVDNHGVYPQFKDQAQSVIGDEPPVALDDTINHDSESGFKIRLDPNERPSSLSNTVQPDESVAVLVNAVLVSEPMSHSEQEAALEPQNQFQETGRGVQHQTKSKVLSSRLLTLMAAVVAFSAVTLVISSLRRTESERGEFTLPTEVSKSNRALAIVDYINSISAAAPIVYTSTPQPDDSIFYNVTALAEERALAWLIDVDPALVQETNLVRLRQRFVLVSWWLQWSYREEVENSWLTHYHECSWDEGFDCGRSSGEFTITAIDKKDSLVDGSLPSDLGLLTDLTRLELASNRLTGTIPNQIGSMSSLEYLRLDKNSLEGSIPTEMGLLTSLTFLAISNNQLNESLPIQLDQLENLTHGYLYNNNFMLGSSNPLCKSNNETSFVRMIVDCDAVKCPVGCCTSCCPKNGFGGVPGYNLCDA